MNSKGWFLLAIGLVGLSLSSLGRTVRAQEPNPMSKPAPAQDNEIMKQDNGIYIYRVKVVQRDLDAVGYLHRSGSTRIVYAWPPLSARWMTVASA